MIRRMDKDDVLQSGVLALVWRVFKEFEAPEYSPEGIREFQDFIAPDAVGQRMDAGELFFWGYFHGDSIAGVIATKPPCHISLLFVDKAHHRKGIARSLYQAVLEDNKQNTVYCEMTVNSSPYAVEAYRKLGFVETGSEQTVNGLRFIPMKHRFR